MPLAELIGVSKRYRTHAGEIVAVREVDLVIERGEFVVVTGRSGSGKSTLLSLLGALSTPSEGTVRLFGDDVGGMSDEARSSLRACRLGFVFQFSGLLPTLHALDNVRLPVLFGPGDSDSAALRARELLRRVGLGERLGAWPEQLSGGEQRRVALARALIARPELLLADEPTGDLDAQTEAHVMSILHELHDEGLTVVLATHNLNLRAGATRWLEMTDGRLDERSLA